MKNRLLRDDDPRIAKYKRLASYLSMRYVSSFNGMERLEDLEVIALETVWYSLSQWREDGGLNLTSYVERAIRQKFTAILQSYGLRDRIRPNGTRYRTTKRHPHMVAFSFQETSEETGEEFSEFMCGNFEPLEEVIDEKKRIWRLRYAYRNVRSRDMSILRRRFFEEETLEGIGEDLNVTRERVRQIEARGLKALRKALIR